MTSPTLMRSGRPAELIAAVRPFAALDQAAVLEREQDVLEKLLGDRVVLGEIADEHRALSRARVASASMALRPYFAFASQHQKIHKVYSVYRV